MKILSRYVVREHVGPLLFALSALTSLLLLNYVAKQFGQLVGKGLGWNVIGEFFLLSIPFTVAMTLPMAVLVSVLYAFSRLASENEITALKASGVGMPSMLRPVLLGAAVIAGFMIFFNDQVLPRANHRLRVLQGDIARKKPTFALREQVINEVSPGKLSLRAGHLDEGSNRMREVTIYDLGDPQRRRTIHADSGELMMAADQQDLELILHSGYIQELPREQEGQLQRIHFTRNLVRVRDVFNSLDRSTNDTYKSDREMSICEMQQEVATAQRDADLARAELRTMLANVAHRSATGRDRAASPPPATPRPRRSVANWYCRAIGAMGVKEAQAATLPPQEPARAVPPPSTRAMPESAKVDRTGRPTLPWRPGMARLPGDTAVGLLPRHATPMLGGGYESRGNIAVPATLGYALSSIETTRARLEDNEQTANTFEVEIQKKFSLAVACIVFVLLGAPIALRFPRGGVGLTIGVSLGVFALYYVGLIGGEELANRGILSPFWAMWATNVLFTIVGLLLLSRMGKEGATSRGGDLGELFEGWKMRRQARRERKAARALAAGRA